MKSLFMSDLRTTTAAGPESRRVWFFKLQVPVHDAPSASLGKALQDLLGAPNHSLRREWPIKIERLPQRAAIDLLHQVEVETCERRVDVEGPNRVRMPRGLCESDLEFEPLSDVGLVDDVGPQDLHCGVRGERLVNGSGDHAERTVTDLPRDTVASDPGSPAVGR